MADRYAVPFQAFITNGAVITSNVTGRVATAGNTVLTLSTSGGAGTFTITLGSGCTGTLTSGTATITGSVLALIAGANVCTSNGAGNCTLNLTLGTAANANIVTTWSATSGGVSGASVPTSADNAYMNVNSFTAASQVLTVDTDVNCLDMDWTGATNSPRMTLVNGGQAVVVYRNATFISAMSTLASGGYWKIIMAGAGDHTITQNGCNLQGVSFLSNGGTTTLGGAWAPGPTTRLTVGAGSFDTANYAVSVSYFDKTGADVVTVTLGSSLIIVTESYAGALGGWTFSGANTNLVAGTSTIRLINQATSHNHFTGGGYTYNIVELAGDAHEIIGSNTCAILRLLSNKQMILFAPGTLLKVGHLLFHSGSEAKFSFAGHSSSVTWNRTQPIQTAISPIIVSMSRTSVDGTGTILVGNYKGSVYA